MQQPLSAASTAEVEKSTRWFWNISCQQATSSSETLGSRRKDTEASLNGFFTECGDKEQFESEDK